MSLTPRLFTSPLQRLLREFPIVCLLGPRQCGKTTFVKEQFPEWAYFDLEKPSHRTAVESDPEGFMNRHPHQIIFDEAQQFPPLFPLLRSFVDEHKGKTSKILLLGSASPNLIRNVSESLAGRVGFLDMTPFQMEEVEDENRLWLCGGFPTPYLAKTTAQRFDWFEGYTRTFIERDLKLYGIEVRPVMMRRLWTMLAHVHGGILNASELGNALGMNYHTINHYIDILEQTFLIRRLSPYFVNIGKRLVKSPKIYLRDTGLLHYFLHLNTKEEILVSPKCGASWEGFVMEQLMDAIRIKKPDTEFYFWQTATKQEVDLLIKEGEKIIPIEIKRHTAPKKEDVGGLFFCMKDLKLKKGFIVRPEGESRYSLGEGVEVLSLVEILDIFK
ncbi:MAG: ATP-binding protein [Deltaproteobacteria bacterium]|nr:ATP-binding protein [Deltaproteobacteria bacterium]